MQRTTSNSALIPCILIVVAVITCLTPSRALAQGFGVELQASLMPASGAMGGAAAARPQDVQSALAINPATLTQFHGTNFGFSGAWAEPTISMNQETAIPLANIEPFNSKSQRPGSIVGNIGVTQELNALGLPITTGMGLLTSSGIGVNYRDQLGSNGTTAELVVIGTAMGAGVQLSDKLSLGGLLAVSTASMDGVFSGITASTPDYNMRGLFGVTYELSRSTTIGGYWHTVQQHTFTDFVRFGGAGNPFMDVRIQLPRILGLGVADRSLLDGRLLLAIDFTYFHWSDADFFGSIWDNQWAVKTGVQYTGHSGLKYRLGYTWAEDASLGVRAEEIGGIDPQSTVDYIQALFPNINQHRISGGLGIPNVLPNVDVDLFAGGMFRQDVDFGDSTVSVASYWIGFGATWRFGGCGSGCRKGGGCGDSCCTMPPGTLCCPADTGMPM